MKILKTFWQHKEQIHEEKDPIRMKQISKVFDVRWWEKFRLEKIDKPKEEMKSHIFEMIKKNLEEGSEFIKGEDIAVIEADMKFILGELIECLPLLQQACRERNLKSQWDLISKEFPIGIRNIYLFYRKVTWGEVF